MEDFYDAMKTYIDSKKPKKICKHKRTFHSYGYKTCVECGLLIHKVFHQDPYSHVSGYNLTKSKEDRSAKIESIMIEMINSVTREKSWIMIETMNLVTKEKSWIKSGRYGWGEPLKNGLPLELLDHLIDLRKKCVNLNVKCNTRSLCAVVLWDKVKFLYPKMMTLTKFSKKVGVSVPTIIKILKKI